jgi:Spy/CpxP family protein refolding chaperone
MSGINQQQSRAMKFTDEQITQIEQIMAAAMKPVGDQLAAGKGRMDRLTDRLDKNNAKTDAMFEMFETAQKGLNVLGSIGNGMKWCAGIVSAVVIAYTAWKGGKP